MSLILEALRKREREKQLPERGFLVTAETPWAPGRDRSPWLVLAAAVLAFGLGAAFVSLRGPARVAPAPSLPEMGLAAKAPSLAPAPLGTLLPAVTRASPSPSAPASPPEALPVLPTPSPSAKPLVLQAISERDGQRVALISDHLLREGDTLDGARILHIGETEVELELDGRRLTLRF